MEDRRAADYGLDELDCLTTRYIEALKAKTGNEFKCPVCGREVFGVVPGHFHRTIQKEGAPILMAGPGINSMALICQHCGYLLEFDLATLERKAGC